MDITGALIELHEDQAAEFPDRPFLASLVRRIRSGGDFGPNQQKAATMLLRRYNRLPHTDPALHRLQNAALVTITTEADKFVVRTPFRLKDTCKGIFGARWDKGRRAWTYNASPTSAKNIVDGFAGHQLQTDDAFDEFIAEASRREEIQVVKLIEDHPDIPSKTEAWTHQRQAFYFAGQLQAAMLGMDMGTGKSKVAVDLVSNSDAKRVLIICPRAVVPVWPREFAKHSIEDNWMVLPLGKDSGTVAKRTVKAQEAYNSAIERVAIVINYDAARQGDFQKWSTSVEWDYVILDECHRIKDGQSVTNRYCARLRTKAKRRLGLTGTPLPQGPLDAFGQFKFLDPDIFGQSFTTFRARYAIMGGYENREIKGYKNEEEFNEKFYSISFRVSSDDVLDLPGEHDVTMPCTLSPRARKLYQQIEDEYVANIRGSDAGTLFDPEPELGGEVTADNALTRLLRLQQITGGALHDDDHNIHVVDEAKAELLADIVSDLPADKPVVVFCRFVHDLDVVEALATKLKRTYGEVSGRRNDMNTDATMRPETQILAVQIQSGSEGIDLTRAHVAIFYSLGFSLAQYLQARRRLSRPGQTEKVLFMHLVADDSVDEQVYAALEAREEVIDYILKQLRYSR